MRSWVVRAGRNGEREGAALAEGKAFAGWSDFFIDLSSVERDGLDTELRTKYPDESNYTIGSWVGQLHRFSQQMQQGDILLMPLKGADAVAIGFVSSQYEYDGQADPGLQHFRRIAWRENPLPLHNLRGDLRTSLGGLATVFEIKRNGAAERFKIAHRTGRDPGIKDSEIHQLASFDDLSRDAITTTTVRNLLDLVGATRRSNSALTLIQGNLAERSLTTDGDLVDRNIDDEIDICPIPTQQKARSARWAYFPVSMFIPKDQTLVAVDEDESVDRAQSLMIKRNFSQLPVTRDGALVGVLTWDSMAAASLGGTVTKVHEAMDLHAAPVSHHISIDAIWGDILKRGFAFASDDDANLKIITVFDLADKFAKERLPLMQIEELEIRLRGIVKATGLSSEDLNSAASRSVERRKANSTASKGRGKHGLTLGSYPLIFEDEKVWKLLNHPGMNQAVFAEALQHAADLRNSLMHFSQDDPDEGELQELNGALRLARALTTQTSLRQDLPSTP